jgi:hypothetical protein
MPATVNGGGDQLARGAARATFKGPNVTQDKWDEVFGANSGPKKNYEASGSDSGSEPAGTASVKPRKAKKRKV